MRGLHNVHLAALSLASLVCSAVHVEAKGKYSKEVNLPKENYMMEDNPFRMQKVNLLWQKAKKRLADQKLKVLYSDLKIQDKEELTLKKLKSDGQDKEGVKEAQLRRTLSAIMKKYGLDDPWNKPVDNEASDGYPENTEHINKLIFKDKKLNKLWTKAEKSRFSEVELKMLKEEFEHHQEKIDQYYQLMDKVNDFPNDDKDGFENTIDLLDGERKTKPKTDSPHAHQLLKEKHKELKRGYDDLVTKMGIDKKEFEEYAVQRLWELAEKGDFTPGELGSLREELHHYEKRIKKLRYFQGELDLVNDRHGANKWENADTGGEKPLHKKVKELEYKVNKVHNELENRILQRHSEL